MTNAKARTAGLQVNTGPLAAGAVLIGVGSLLGLAGLALTGATLARGVRRWLSEMEVPPGELMRQQMAKAKAATTAGATAWRNGAVTTEPHRT